MRIARKANRGKGLRACRYLPGCSKLHKVLWRIPLRATNYRSLGIPRNAQFSLYTEGGELNGNPTPAATKDATGVGDVA